MFQNDNKNEVQSSVGRPRYAADYDFARRLIHGEERAWEFFSGEFRKKIKEYAARKYSSVLGDVEIEEICDGVEKRIMVNDYKAIREYRGECALSAYITKATDWEITDWLRKNSARLMHDTLETLDERGASPSCEHEDSVGEEIPEAIKALSDDLRWAFLLRYYDDFDFPFYEIRLIAKKQNVSIRAITQRIVKYLEPQGGDILAEQRNKRRLFYHQLQKVWSHLQESYTKERRLMDAQAADEPAQPEKLEKIRTGREQLEAKREKLLKKKGKISITTPYEIIAIILGEENVSTVRSRVFLAKKQLADRCIKF